MSGSGPPPVVQLAIACSDKNEFGQKFEAKLLARGMVARGQVMQPVGARVRLKLLLRDGTLAIDEEAQVQSLVTNDGKQAMVLKLMRNGPPAKAPPPFGATSAGSEAIALPAPSGPPAKAN